MQTYTMAELGRSTKAVCAEVEPVLITSNGKPQSIVINVADLPVDESVSLAREIYGQHCIRQMRGLSRLKGLDVLDDAAIEAEIAAARSAR